MISMTEVQPQLTHLLQDKEVTPVRLGTLPTDGSDPLVLRSSLTLSFLSTKSMGGTWLLWL
jgi:hypothetical protein